MELEKKIVNIRNIMDMNINEFVLYRDNIIIDFLNTNYPNYIFDGTMNELIDTMTDDVLINIFSQMIDSRLFSAFAINHSLNPEKFRNYIRGVSEYSEALVEIRDFLKNGIFLFKPDKTYKLKDVILNINYDNYDLFFLIDGDNVKRHMLPLLNNYNRGWLKEGKRVLILIVFRWDIIPRFIKNFMIKSRTQPGINDTIKIIQTYNNKKDAADVNLISVATIITNKLLSSLDICLKRLFIITNDRFAIELEYILNDLAIKCMTDVGEDIVTVIDQKDKAYDKWISIKYRKNNEKIRKRITTQSIISGWFVNFYKNNYDKIDVRPDYKDIYNLIQLSNNYSDVISNINKNYLNNRDKKILYGKYDILLGI